jgi:predicted glycogen debranching enzyme
MKRILAALADGTAGNRVFLDSEGLLHSGTPDTQLTWMDALVDGRPVTPRWGYAVEICALWYNAVCFAAELAHALGDTSFTPPQHPEPIAAAFRRRFWLPAAGYLADVVNDAGVDEAVRPNQVFACSLPYSPLTAEMQRAVVDRVQDELLTPMGLRTLSPRDPRYRGRYSGDPATRDQAYHQGTVWPWLLGHFGEAYLRTCSDRRAACAFLKSSLRVWRDHLLEAGLGSVSEVFDGDPPHRPGGCVAQAWSVAELIRLYCLLGDPESCGS